MLNPLYRATARIIVAIHGALVHVLGTGGWGWALSIVLLTMAVRLVLFPLFVKQIKAQRTMQLMQPKIKEIKEKYKHDKQRQNEEMIKLQKEHGNPLLGCLPILVQIPLFFALFSTLDAVVPKHTHGPYVPHSLAGLNLQQASAMAHAKIFGVSLASAFTSSSATLRYLGSSLGGTKVLTVLLIVIMMVSTFITQKQLFGRNPSMDPSQAKQQKLMLYASPLLLGVFGFKFPVGVLLYWFTTNVWSMGQQFFVLKRMPAPGVPMVARSAGTGGFSLGRLLGMPAPPVAPALSANAQLPPVKATPTEPRAVVPGRAGSVLPADGLDRPPVTAVQRRPGSGTTHPPRRRGKNQRRGGRR